MTTIDGPEPFLADIGRRVRLARVSVPMTQAELAAACGLDRSYIGEVERGAANASLLVLWKLAVALNVEPATLLPSATQIGLTGMIGSITAAKDTR